MLFFIRMGLVLLCGIAVSSCAVQAGPTSTYVLTAVPTVSAKHSHRHVAVLVTLPDLSPAYNTTEMAYTTQPYQMSYFVKSGWLEAPSHMLQPLIQQTLINTHAFQAVGASAAMGHFDYAVNTQILQFEQDFTSARSVFRLGLRVQLLDAVTNRIIASKDITVVEPAPQNTPYGGVIAANQATSKALMAIAQFCLQRL